MSSSVKFVRPCIPTTAKAIPHGDAWLHEPKLDGYRFQIVKDGRQVRLYSRSGYEWTRRLPKLAETLRGLPCHSAVLDGELCLPGPGGAPDFRGLQGALASRGELAVYVFDLLRRDEDDLTAVPLSQRKQLLMRLVGRDFPCLQPVPTFEDGAKLLEASERHGLEGIVSKRKASAYRSGPSRDWVKDQDCSLASGEPREVAAVSEALEIRGKGAGDALLCQTILGRDHSKFGTRRIDPPSFQRRAHFAVAISDHFLFRGHAQAPQKGSLAEAHPSQWAPFVVVGEGGGDPPEATPLVTSSTAAPVAPLPARPKRPKKAVKAPDWRTEVWR